MFKGITHIPGSQTAPIMESNVLPQTETEFCSSFFYVKCGCEPGHNPKSLSLRGKSLANTRQDFALRSRRRQGGIEIGELTGQRYGNSSSGDSLLGCRSSLL